MKSRESWIAAPFSMRSWVFSTMPALDVAYVNPFIKAVDGLMSTMVKVPATLRKPRLRGRGERLNSPFSIAVQIDLSGPTQGVVAVAFSRPVALKLASALAGFEMTTLDADCRDALGEIGNMLVGQAKPDLPGGTTRMSVPKVVETADVPFPRQMPVLLLPFDTAVGPFLIAVACRSGAAEPAAPVAA